jgi:asparagine synthase (glutamine-hydrolysing)
MCGILFTNRHGCSRELFLEALDLMKHRGPDASGCYWEGKELKLGHNRLKILDLDNRSNQPFFSHDNRYVIIYNGEIYNFHELARKNEIKMRTTCDTELLLELFIKLGPKMLNQLNGMFAFVIVDTKKGDVFICRDRLGIKPLYYSQDGKLITVSSEVASLLKIVGESDFDEIALRQYRKLRSFFGGRTIYSNIKMLPAGHYMLNGKLKKYWTLPEGPQDIPTEEEIKYLLQSAVDYRCISDVPVGSYLSGGLDSTIVAGLASKPYTWTVGFPNENEFEWGRMAAKHFDSIHTEVIVQKEEFLDVAAEMIKQRKEPLSVPNEVLLFKMTKEVKKKNTVVLSGEGADELFFGYDRIFRWAASSEWDIEQFSQRYCYGSNEDIEIVEDVLASFMHIKSTLDRVAAFFQTAHLHGLLRRLDNSTMLCSVEARVPFVDHRLVERMAGVPFDYRMKDGQIKYPLKSAFTYLVPNEIVNRKKIGFPVPLDDIFRTYSIKGQTPMDKWLEFNLQVLTDGGYSHQDIK